MDMLTSLMTNLQMHSRLIII